MIWRNGWLHSPSDTTIKDLQNYFRQVTYCLIVGKIGNIPTDDPSVFEQNNPRNWQSIINDAEQSISLGEKLFNLIKLAKSLFM